VRSKGILDILKKVFTYCTKQTRKEALWLVSNIAANSEADSQALVESPVAQHLLSACRDSSYELRKEGMWALSNLVHKLPDPAKLVDMDVMSCLIDILQRDGDSGTIASLGLTALNEVLARSEVAKIAFAKLGGEDVVIELQLSQYHEVYKVACEILERHCGAEEMTKLEKMEFINSKDQAFHI